MAALTFPYTGYIGLAVQGVEVSVPGYIRQPITLAYAVDGVTISNLASLQWQHATQSWGTIDTVQLWDAQTGGNFLGNFTPQVPVLIDMYDIARIPASGFQAIYSSVAGGYGRAGFGVGAWGRSANYAFYPATTTLIPYSSGLYSADVYGGVTDTTFGVLLQRDFDQQTHLCGPGTWTPGPFSLAA